MKTTTLSTGGNKERPTCVHIKWTSSVGKKCRKILWQLVSLIKVQYLFSKITMCSPTNVQNFMQCVVCKVRWSKVCSMYCAICFVQCVECLVQWIVQCSSCNKVCIVHCADCTARECSPQQQEQYCSQCTLKIDNQSLPWYRSFFFPENFFGELTNLTVPQFYLHIWEKLPKKSENWLTGEHTARKNYAVFVFRIWKTNLKMIFLQEHISRPRQ